MLHKPWLLSVIIFSSLPVSCAPFGGTSSGTSSEANSTSLTTSQNTSDSSATSNSLSSSVPASSSETSETPVLLPSQEYLDFWDPATELSFSFTAPYASLKAIQDAYDTWSEVDDDEYRPVNLDLTMKTSSGEQTYHYLNVGIRMKGNTSRRSFLNTTTGNMYALIHYKLSFDEFTSGQTLFGMKKIDIKWNKNYDSTQIKQVYAYTLFDAFGVISPHSTVTPVTMDVSGTPSGATTHYNLGIYEVIECIDKTFIKRHFSDAEAGGNLYKCTYSGTGKANLTMDNAVYQSGGVYYRVSDGKIGIEDLTTGYHPSYDLKTNESAEDYGDIVNLIGLLNSTTNYGDTSVQNAVANLVDISYFLKFEAASYLMGNPDDVRNNYNNFYLYFGATSGKAYFIPYDWDRCFGITRDWNPSGNGMTTILPFSNKDISNQTQEDPLYKFSVLSGGNATWRKEYATDIADLLTGEWFTLAQFTTFYNAFHAHYAGDEVVSGLSDPNENYYEPYAIDDQNNSNWSFASYVNAKKTTATNAIHSAYSDLLA